MNKYGFPDDLYRCIECWKLSRIRDDKTIPLCPNCSKMVTKK
jgi:DNA-directed RNA polymerase subunit RPC12/RpoP